MTDLDQPTHFSNSPEFWAMNTHIEHLKNQIVKQSQAIKILHQRLLALERKNEV